MVSHSVSATERSKRKTSVLHDTWPLTPFTITKTLVGRLDLRLFQVSVSISVSVLCLFLSALRAFSLSFHASLSYLIERFSLALHGQQMQAQLTLGQHRSLKPTH